MKKRILCTVLAVIMLISSITVVSSASAPEDLSIYDIENEAYGAVWAGMATGYYDKGTTPSTYLILDYLLYADKLYELIGEEEGWAYTFDEFIELVDSAFTKYDKDQIKDDLTEMGMYDAETDTVAIGMFGGYGGPIEPFYEDMIYLGNGKYKVNYFLIDYGVSFEEDPEAELEGLEEGYDYLVFEDEEYKYGIIAYRYNIFFDANDGVKLEGYEKCDYHIHNDNIYYNENGDNKTKHRIILWTNGGAEISLLNTPTAVDVYSETAEQWFGDEDIKFEITLEEGFKLEGVMVYCGWDEMEYTEKDGVYTVSGADYDALYIDVYTSRIPVNAAEKFDDVKEENWFTDYVSYAVTQGLFKGTSDTEFSPNESMTRGMFATVLYRMDGENFDGDIDTAFEDVDTSKYYGPAIAWAYENGIVNGMSESEFGVNIHITREQMCTMLVRYASEYLGLELKDTQDKKTFADDDAIHDWAKDAVYACQKAAIINGMTETTFVPQGTATRAQVAKILTVFHTSYIHVAE